MGIIHLLTYFLLELQHSLQREMGFHSSSLLAEELVSLGQALLHEPARVWFYRCLLWHTALMRALPRVQDALYPGHLSVGKLVELTVFVKPTAASWGQRLLSICLWLPSPQFPAFWRWFTNAFGTNEFKCLISWWTNLPYRERLGNQSDRWLACFLDHLLLIQWFLLGTGDFWRGWFLV